MVRLVTGKLEKQQELEEEDKDWGMRRESKQNPGGLIKIYF